MARSVWKELALAAVGWGLMWGSAVAFCFDRAGELYGVPPALLYVIAEQESGLDAFAIHQNPDGSADYGLMQVNSSWVNKLGEKRWAAVRTDPCYNVIVGAWILADCLRRHGYTWEGLGCYNAVSRHKRAVYARKIIEAIEEKKEKMKDSIRVLKTK